MKDWLVAVGVFSLICAVADMLLPKTNLSRYARLALSLMLTYLMVSPVVRLKGGEINLDIPVIESDFETDGNEFVDKEFSNKLTRLVIEQTGFDNISLSVSLSYDSYKSVSVIGAHQWQREELTRLLGEEYGVPPEIISYGTD